MSYKYTVGGKYQSRNEDEIDKLTNQYLNEQYDPSKDQAFQDYADIVRKQGNLAMQDTMGKAASLTGGYGNSYAQTAGQQVYNNYASQIGAAQKDFQNSYTQDLLSRLGILQNQEQTDRANWEADYAQAYADAQNKATYDGDYSDLAKVLSVSEDGLKNYYAGVAESEKISGLKDLIDAQIEAYKAAIKNGTAEAYIDELNSLDYNTTDLYKVRGSWEESGQVSNTIDANGDNVGAEVGRYNKTVNSNIRGLKSTDKGEWFRVKVPGKGEENLNVMIGDQITDPNSAIKQYVDQTVAANSAANGLIVYNGKLYYADGTGNVFAVEEREKGDLDALIKLIYN